VNVKIDDYGTVRVTVSRRNLRTLLAKLDEPTSQRTLVRRTEDHFLFITAEDDDVHYSGREAGEVHPREEAKLKEAA